METIDSATVATSTFAEVASRDRVLHREGQQHEAELAALRERHREQQVLVETHAERSSQREQHEKLDDDQTEHEGETSAMRSPTSAKSIDAPTAMKKRPSSSP